MRSVSVRLCDLGKVTIPIGFVDENLHTQVRVDCKKMFDEYPAAAASLTVSPPEGSAYPAITTRDGDFVVWDITASDVASDGRGEIQLTFTVGEVVAKSYVGTIRVTRSLNASGDIPDPIQDWITQANEILDSIPGTIDTALEAAKESGEFDGPQGPAGADGQPGADGYSPSASVSKSGSTATITITDQNGTTTAQISDGAAGATGQTGPAGADGTTFTPSVSEQGVISWTNDGGRTNPESVNIKGPKGDTGDPAPAASVTTAVDAYLAENFSNPSNPPLDRTLLSSSSAAPADLVGNLKNAVTSLEGGTTGQVLRKKSNSDMDVEWAAVAQPTDAQVESAVDGWLTDHPEATTTVQDGSLTEAKFSDETKMKVLNNYVTPEMFGAKGDGTTDDTAAINEALNQDMPVVFTSKKYAVTEDLIGDAPEIYGNGAEILPQNVITRVFNLTGTKKIDGININYDGIGGQIAILVQSTNNVEISNISVHDLYDTNSDYGTTLIIADGGKCVHVHDINIYECKKKGNGVVTESAGGLKGITVRYYTEQCIIEDVTIKEIHNVDASGNIIKEDCDAIFVPNNILKTSATIQNIYGYNFGKRLIKTQCENVNISNIYAYSNLNDLVTIIGIQLYNDAENGKHSKANISNCILINEDNYSTSEYNYSIASTEEVNICNCTIISPYKFAFENIGNMNITNCKIYGYGIMNVGERLKLNNIYTLGACFIGETGNSSNAKEINVSNSTIEYEQSAGHSYSHIALWYGLNVFENCVFKNAYIDNKADAVIRSCQFEQSSSVALLCRGGNTKVEDCVFKKASGSTLASQINVYGTSAVCDVRSCEFFDTTYSISGSGIVKIKDTDISKILATNLASLTVYPMYYTSLPANSTLPNGIKILYETDGKMYEMQNHSWNPV